MRRHRGAAAVALAATVASVLPASVAFAGWFASGATGGAGRAASLGPGSVPTATVRRRSVTVRWAPVTLAGTDRAADRYTVIRSGTAPGDPGATVTCEAVVERTSCTETAVPDGAWRYSVVPHLQSWTGTAGPGSEFIRVVPPRVVLPRTAVSAADRRLPGVALTGFGAGEQIELTVEPGAVALGSVTAGADGNVRTVDIVVPPGVVDGTYALQAVGSLSPEPVASAGFAVDTVAPVTTSSPTPPPWVNASFVVRLAATDAGPSSGIAGITWQLGTDPPVTVAGDQASVPITAGGALAWHATDLAGNQEPGHSIDVQFDGAAPVVEPPPIAALVHNGVVLRSTPFDAGSGVVSVTYLYCSGTTCTPNIPIGGAVAAPYNITWITQPANGTYRVATTALDAAGNVGRSDAITVTVDNLGPTGSLGTLPAVVGAVIPLTATATDPNGVASVRFEYSATGTDWLLIATVTDQVDGVYGVVWDAHLVNPGAYSVRAVATDRAGSSTTFAPINVRFYGPSSLQLQNGGGPAGVGTIGKGDKIVVKLAAAPRLIAVCPGAWNTSAPALVGSVTVKVEDGGDTNDRMTISSTACGAGGGNFGTVALGSPAYVDQAGAVFSGLGVKASSIAWDPANLQLTVTLGDLSSGTVQPVTTPTVAAYTMSPNAVAANLVAPAGSARTGAPGGVVNF